MKNLLFALFIIVFATACTQQTNPQNTDSTAEAKSYALEEVTKHATEDDCWAVIDGKVYDLFKQLK